MLYFDTDYMEGAHPAIINRLCETNLQHTVGYGNDQYTASAREKIKKACGIEDGIVFFLAGGTQTNSIMLDALLQKHEGVLAANTGHIAAHESGAVEYTGHKVLTLPHHQGKVKAADVEEFVTTFYKDDTYEHQVAPGVLYISNPTEYGTIYSLAELTELSNLCHSHDIRLYVDGARMGYGLAAENNDITLPDLARLADAFYIGGTKVGALFGEAVVIPNKKSMPHWFPFIKQHGALMAKGRILGLQFETLFTDNLYTNIAKQAVSLAQKIKNAFASKGFAPYIDSPTNQQFFLLPNEVIDRLRKVASFEYWGPRGETETVVRFVTSWATTPEDVDALIKEILR